MIKNISMIGSLLAIVSMTDVDAMMYQVARGARFQNVASVSKATEALIAACMAKNHEQARECIDEGADINIAVGEKQTALMYAATNCCYYLAEAILQRGDANVNIVGANGNTALMCAVQTDYGKMVSLLLANNANVRVRGGGEKTALIVAAQHGYVRIAERILCSLFVPGRNSDMNRGEQSWMVNLQNAEGRTALMYAAINNHEGMVAFLMRSLSHIEITDNAGNTALTYARSNGNANIAGLINSGVNMYEDFFAEEDASQPITIFSITSVQKIDRYLQDNLQINFDGLLWGNGATE